MYYCQMSMLYYFSTRCNHCLPCLVKCVATTRCFWVYSYAICVCYVFSFALAIGQILPHALQELPEIRANLCQLILQLSDILVIIRHQLKPFFVELLPSPTKLTYCLITQTVHNICLTAKTNSR